MKPHPCLDEEWSTTFKKTYLKPLTRTKPNAHLKFPGLQYDVDPTMTDNENKRISHLGSGFQNNAQLFDNTSWRTSKNLHTDIKRTEYRNRFNRPKPFHKSNFTNSHGRLAAKERFKVYDTVNNNPNTNWEQKGRFRSIMRNKKDPSTLTYEDQMAILT